MGRPCTCCSCCQQQEKNADQMTTLAYDTSGSNVYDVSLTTSILAGDGSYFKPGCKTRESSIELSPCRRLTAAWTQWPQVVAPASAGFPTNIPVTFLGPDPVPDMTADDCITLPDIASPWYLFSKSSPGSAFINQTRRFRHSDLDNSNFYSGCFFDSVVPGSYSLITIQWDQLADSFSFVGDASSSRDTTYTQDYVYNSGTMQFDKLSTESVTTASFPGITNSTGTAFQSIILQAIQGLKHFRSTAAVQSLQTNDTWRTLPSGLDNPKIINGWRRFRIVASLSSGWTEISATTGSNVASSLDFSTGSDPIYFGLGNYISVWLKELATRGSVEARPAPGTFRWTQFHSNSEPYVSSVSLTFDNVCVQFT